ncbi:MAG: hypothetical protein ACHQHO_02875 [Solirubrobacterales bacterium]
MWAICASAGSGSRSADKATATSSISRAERRQPPTWHARAGTDAPTGRASTIHAWDGRATSDAPGNDEAQEHQLDAEKQQQNDDRRDNHSSQDDPGRGYEVEWVADIGSDKAPPVALPPEQLAGADGRV